MNILVGLLIWMLWTIPVFAGASRTCDGTDDALYQSISDAGDLDPSAGSFSFGIWFNTSDSTGLPDALVEADDDVNADKYRMQIDSNGKVTCHMDAGSGDSATATSTTTVNDGKWHFAFCVRSALRTSNIWVDGASEASASWTLGSGIDVEGSTYDACADSAESNNLAADVAYWHHYNGTGAILTAQQVNEIMWHPGIEVTVLVQLIPIWGLNSPEQDLTGRGNTKTLIGTAESANGPPVFFGGGLPL